MNQKLLNQFKDSLESDIELDKKIFGDEDLLRMVAEATDAIVDCLKKGNRILLAGNGGSSADSIHFEAELVGRYKKDRRAYDAIALCTGISSITAIGNDYGFEQVFSREVEAYGRKGDLLVSFSTTGNSVNILQAIAKANELGIKTISFLGNDGGKAKEISNIAVVVPVTETNRIQEIHEHFIHTISGIIEEEVG